ncbi:MAG TPA: hypothetical protein VFO46_00315 [Candidatus Sulfotelmatobacter sp.]|nr:hypothetical protein [Candidatus Sulfotelmatobacter sp.]
MAAAKARFLLAVAAKMAAGYNRLPSRTRNQRRQRFLTPAYKTPDYKTIVRLFLVAAPATHVFFLWYVRGHIARRYPAVSPLT